MQALFVKIEGFEEEDRIDIERELASIYLRYRIDRISLRRIYINIDNIQELI